MENTNKARAMVVDDEIHIQKMITGVLKSMNCDVVAVASNGQEAIDLYVKERPDIVFMDVNMPLKRGDEALVEILHSFPKAFIVMLTSMSDVNTIQKCIDAGAANYIRKDTPVPKLKLLIKETWREFNNRK